MRISNDSIVNTSVSSRFDVGLVEIGELKSVQNLNIESANIDTLSGANTTITVSQAYEAAQTNVLTSWNNTDALTLSGNLNAQNFIVPDATFPALTVNTINVQNLHQPNSSTTTGTYNNIQVQTLSIDDNTNITNVNTNKATINTINVDSMDVSLTDQTKPDPEPGVCQLKGPLGVCSLDFGIGEHPNVETFMQWQVANSLPALIGYNLTLNAFDNGTAFGNRAALLSLCSSSQAPYRTLRFETNGNFVIYSATNNVLWSSGTSVSDERIKTNIQIIRNALDKVEKLDGFYYKYILDIDPDGARRLGVSAQTLQEVFPEAVISEDGVEYLRVQLERLTPLLSNAALELYDKQALLLSQLNNIPSAVE